MELKLKECITPAHLFVLENKPEFVVKPITEKDNIYYGMYSVAVKCMVNGDLLGCWCIIPHYDKNLVNGVKSYLLGVLLDSIRRDGSEGDEDGKEACSA